MEGFTVTGCGTSYTISLWASDTAGGTAKSGTGGRFPRDRPVQIYRVTLDSNQGTALHMGAGTAAVVDSCRLRKNGIGAKKEKVKACIGGSEGTLLALTDSQFSENECSHTVWFSGDEISAQRSLFDGNRGTAIAATFAAAPANLYAGLTNTLALSSVLRVLNCRFYNNSASSVGFNLAFGGGGVFVGANVVAEVANCTFMNNSALTGGGIHVDETACLKTLHNSSFSGNHAITFGGGLYGRSPGCSRLLTSAYPTNGYAGVAMQWGLITMTKNTAGIDGGAMYLEQVSGEMLTVTNSSFVKNEAQGEEQYVDDMQYISSSMCASAAGSNPSGMGWGGAIYLSFLSGAIVRWQGIELRSNRANSGGGAIYVCGLTDTSSITAQWGLWDAVVEDNWAGDTDGNVGEETEGGAVRMAGSSIMATFDQSRYARNRAARGGAMSFGVDWGLLFVGTSLDDFADLRPRDIPWRYHAFGNITVFKDNEATALEGGALYVSGTSATFRIRNLVISNNSAALDGGAISGAGPGSQLILGSIHCNKGVCTYVVGNEAKYAGGGLFVGGKDMNVTIRNSLLKGNRVLGDASAGGGFCCQGCIATNISHSWFYDNVAGAFGGGAAVLRTAGDVLVNGSIFEGNKVVDGAVLPGAKAGAGKEAEKKAGQARRLQEVQQVRRLMRAAEGGAEHGWGQQLLLGQPQPQRREWQQQLLQWRRWQPWEGQQPRPCRQQQPVKLQRHASSSGLEHLTTPQDQLQQWGSVMQQQPQQLQLRRQLLSGAEFGSSGGVSASNITGDDGIYRGGGALYLSADGSIWMRNTTIKRNSGPNGGEGGCVGAKGSFEGSGGAAGFCGAPGW